MNIIFLGNGSFKEHKRGVENVIELQARAMTFEKIYYIHWGNKNHAYKHKHYICISLKNNWALFFIINKIIKKIKDKYTCLHSHNPLMSFFYAGKTDIFTVHDGLYYLTRHLTSNYLKLAFFYFVEKTVYLKAKKIHFISNFTKKLSLFGNHNNYLIIPNSSFLEPFTTIKAETSTPLYTGKKVMQVFSVRSIEERARFDLLLDVAKALRNTHYFTIAGKGPLLDFYKKKATDEHIDNILFLGFVTDEQLMELYRETDIVLMLAAYGEGFGLPIIEGYLFNKPVYASNVCAVPEVIIEKEYLLENNVQFILEKLRNPKILPENSYNDFYNKTFANNIVLKQFNEIYKSLA